MILIVEDNETLRRGLVKASKAWGQQAEGVAEGEAAIERLSQGHVDLVITDIRLPGLSGMDLLEWLRERGRSVPVIVLTAYGTIEQAVEAMRRGAFDYVQKPFQIDELEVRVKKALEHHELIDEVNYHRIREQRRYDLKNIIGVSGKIKAVIDLAKRVAGSSATVMISGETGTGKELVAGAIHHLSPRRNRGFVKVNCAALPKNLLESELFGHEKGAFTGADRQRIGRFEHAHLGTIFMDEVADMSPSTQAKVLRVLQEGEFERVGGSKTIRVDVRVIAATNKDLMLSMEEGTFRDDLFYRLNVISIHVPPLRQRPEDISPIARYYLRRFTRDLKKGIDGFSPAARKRLLEYPWPGNIRELINTVERTVLMTEGPLIEADDLALKEGRRPDPAGSWLVRLPEEGKCYHEVERDMVLQALERNNWVQKDAARFLGLSRRVMHYKIQKHGIRHERWRKNRPAGD